MRDETKPPLFTLDRTTLVPLGLLIAVVCSSITATVWINTRLLTLDYAVRRVDEKMQDVREALSGIAADRWSSRDMQHWVELANAANPTLKLPVPPNKQ